MQRSFSLLRASPARGVSQAVFGAGPSGVPESAHWVGQVPLHAGAARPAGGPERPFARAQEYLPHAPRISADRARITHRMPASPAVPRQSGPATEGTPRERSSCGRPYPRAERCCARETDAEAYRCEVSAVRSCQGCAASRSLAALYHSSTRGLHPTPSALRTHRPSRRAPSRSCARSRASVGRDPQDHGLNPRRPPRWVGA